MTRLSFVTKTVLAISALSAPFAALPASADPEPTRVLTAAPAEEITRTEYAGPNGALLGTGILTFGVSYGTSVVLAATSSHQGDGHLYVPIAGPWLDFADRGDCPASSSSCDSETTNKVLLVVDGVFQGIGALSILGAFLSPESREVAVPAAALEKPSVRLTPTRFGRTGYGLAAVGTF